jgi:hypothetical protein
LMDAKNAHFVFLISGRTKSDQTSVPVMQGTHLRPGQLVRQLVETVHGTGHYSGRLFN